MSWNQAEEAFAKHFERYEPRIPQRNGAFAVEQALHAGIHLAAQAGCGVGKSFMGAVPAIDHAFATKLPVVLATGTKALQNQYIRDMETLNRVYKPFRYTVLKGRSNYACEALLNEGPQLSVDLDALKKDIAQEDVLGDLDRVSLPLTDVDRAKITTSSEGCPGQKECKFGKVCWAEKVKEKAKTSQVIITNHALLVTDALITGSNGGALLPEYGAVIVDEAHTLLESATSTLGVELSQNSLSRLASDVSNLLGDQELFRESVIPFAELFTALGDQLDRQTSLAFTPEILVLIGEYVDDVSALFHRYANLVRLYQPEDEKQMEKRKRLVKRLDNIIMKIDNIVLAPFGDLVRWVEKATKTDRHGNQSSQILLKSAPLTVGPFLKSAIWDHVPAVLLSATLAVGGNFNFIADDLGFERGFRSFDAGTPFDYRTQACTYVASNLPDPARDKAGWAAGVTLNLIELVKAAEGRALLLFTSWDDLNAAYSSTRTVIEGLGYRVLRQGEMSNKRLKEIFTDDEHSVLFAVKSFFTGFDVQGDSLRLVVVNKVPWNNPSDIVFNARCEAINRTARRPPWGPDGSFERLSIPSMELTLLQMFGRLIRSLTDKGLVVILDPRLSPVGGKGYAKKVLSVLPPAPVVTDLHSAVSYLKGLNG